MEDLSRFLLLIVSLFLFPLQSLDAPSLQNISFTLRSNQLLAVIGPVGAGKVRAALVELFTVGSLINPASSARIIHTPLCVSLWSSHPCWAPSWESFLPKKGCWRSMVSSPTPLSSPGCFLEPSAATSCLERSWTPRSMRGWSEPALSEGWDLF